MSLFTFNGLEHAVDSVGIKIDNRIIEDKQKRPLVRVCRWTIIGTLRSDGGSGNLEDDITALESAYGDGNKNYGDASFTANGHTHTLPNSTAFSGVRVSAFGWNTGPWKMHTELSNRRSFYAVLQAEYRESHELIAYSEEVQRIGSGGPRWIFMPSLYCDPQRQTLQASTPVQYVQRGVLVKRTTTPVLPSPIFNTVDMHHDKTRVKSVAPKSITTNGTTQTEAFYTLTWMYFAEYKNQVSLNLPTSFNVPTL